MYVERERISFIFVSIDLSEAKSALMAVFNPSLSFGNFEF